MLTTKQKKDSYQKIFSEDFQYILLYLKNAQRRISPERMALMDAPTVI